MAITTTQAQGLALALFGASAGGHLTGLSTAASLETLADDLSTSAGLILGKDLGDKVAFRDHIISNLKLQGDAAAAATAWLDGQLNANTARGDILATAVNFLSTLTDTTSPFYAAAQAFQTTVTAAVAWSSGAGAGEFSIQALREQQGNVEVVAGQSFTLTTATDSFAGTAGNDTVTATSSTLAATDAIVDSSVTDQDVMNVTLTAANNQASVANIETLNFAWNSYSDATVDLTTIVGAKAVNLTSSKVGYLGNATFTATSANNVTAGDGIVGTATFNGVKAGAVITANNASSVAATASAATTHSATVTANSATSVSVTDFATATVNAPKATAITVDDNGKSSAITTLNVDAATAITVTTTAATGTIVINTVDTTALTMTDATGKEWKFTGDGDVTVTTDASVSAEIITNAKTSGSLTVKNADTGTALDLDEVSATTIWLSGARDDATGTETVANGANLKYSASGTDLIPVVDGAGTADSITATVTTATVDDVTLSGVEVLNFVTSAKSVVGTDLSIDNITFGAATVKVALSGANDVYIDTLADAGVLDASLLAGDLIINGTANVAHTITGSQGDNDITLTQSTANSSVTAFDGDDTVEADTSTGTLTVVAGEGDNTVIADAFTTGTLVVVAGAGDDTVAASILSSGTVNLNLGDGDNTVELGDSELVGVAADDTTGTITTGATSKITVTTGTGDDSITLGTANGFATSVWSITTGGGDDVITVEGGDDSATSASVIVINGGEGTDTLVLADATDWRLGTITIGADVEAIQLNGADDDVNAYFQASDMSGATFEMLGDGAGGGFTVKAAATTATIDLSTLVINQEIGSAVTRLAINGDGAAQGVTITGTIAADSITGSAYNDTIVAGKGVDVISGADGDDAIDITEALAYSSIDSITVNAAGSGVDTITGFKVGTDDIYIADATTAGNADAVVATTSATVAAGVTFNISDIDEEAADVIEIAATLSTRGDLDNALDGTELLKALSSSATAAPSITVADATADDDADFYILAYQDGKAYLYYAETDGSAAGDTITASEITLVAVMNGVVAGALSSADFI